MFDLLMTTCNRLEEKGKMTGKMTKAIHKRFDTALSQLEYKFLPSSDGEYTVFHAAARLFKLMAVHRPNPKVESEYKLRSEMATAIVHKVVLMCNGDRSKAQVIANQASVFGRTGKEEWDRYGLETQGMIRDSSNARRPL